jgi:hypothetical protein
MCLHAKGCDLVFKLVVDVPILLYVVAGAAPLDYLAATWFRGQIILRRRASIYIDPFFPIIGIAVCRRVFRSRRL